MIQLRGGSMKLDGVEGFKETEKNEALKKEEIIKSRCSRGGDEYFEPRGIQYRDVDRNRFVAGIAVFVLLIYLGFIKVDLGFLQIN